MRARAPCVLALIAVVVVGAAIPILDQPYLTRLVSTVLIFSIAALSLDLLVGYGGMVSFGHAAFFGLGAYVPAILGIYGIRSGFIVLPAAILVAAAAALVIGAMSLRVRGVYFIMITLAFAQMLYFVFHALTAFGGDDGMKLARNDYAGIIDPANPTTFFYLVMGVFLAAFLLAYRLVHSHFGRVLRGIKDNERRAASLGYNTFLYQLVAFVVAGGMAGLAGMLQGNLNEYASPALLHWIVSGDLLVILIFGGVSTLIGSVLGSAAFILLQEVISIYTKHWMLVLGPLLLLAVLTSSRGIYGLFVRKPQDA
jgi:branched-chain amino acid transport system permease protein